MRVIEASSTYLSTEGLNPYQFMEKAGRTCYKSLDKITNDSAIKFVQGLKKSGHTAMLEHSHIILMVNNKIAIPFINEVRNNDIDVDGTKVRIGNYLNITDCGAYHIISGSFRAFFALFDPIFMSNASDFTKKLLKKLHIKYPELFEDINADKPNTNEILMLSRDNFVNFAKGTFQLCEDKLDKLIMRHLTHTCVFICDRGVSHEFVRHRPASFAQESTRYCNYAKDKFGNEITVIRPVFFEEGSEAYKLWYDGCLHNEEIYFKLIEAGCIAQQARDNLPTSVKTEIIITATEEEWQHIINLRYHGTTGLPHPQMIQSMSMIYDDLCTYSNYRLK